MTAVESRQYKRIVILTGAGISAASGLRTYRGPGGIWSDPETARMSTIENFDEDPDSYWEFWGGLRQAALSAVPSRAHEAVAHWAANPAPDQKFTLVTQNVDELHQRAGSTGVVELHGSIFRTRCSGANCKLPPYRDVGVHLKAPVCPNCGSALRPDIVLFGEALPPEAEWPAKRSLRDCDLFLAIGTSGTVSPASHFVEWAKYAQARTILVNLEPMSPRNPSFDEEVVGRAEDILPSMLR